MLIISTVSMQCHGMGAHSAGWWSSCLDMLMISSPTLSILIWMFLFEQYLSFKRHIFFLICWSLNVLFARKNCFVPFHLQARCQTFCWEVLEGSIFMEWEILLEEQWWRHSWTFLHILSPQGWLLPWCKADQTYRHRLVWYEGMDDGG